jgi:hypothetical protein
MPRNYIEMIGLIWQPGVIAAQRHELREYDIGNIEGIAREVYDSETITRDAVEHWLCLNSGDFSGITDFSGSINGVKFSWNDEESECTYFDCMYGQESE